MLQAKKCDVFDPVSENKASNDLRDIRNFIIRFVSAYECGLVAALGQAVARCPICWALNYVPQLNANKKCSVCCNPWPGEIVVSQPEKTVERPSKRRKVKK